MKLIILSNLYPVCRFPSSGIFVEAQVNALKNKVNGSIVVISPQPWSPRIVWFKKRWREYGQTEKERCNGEVKIYYPRYLIPPIKYLISLRSFFMYLSIKPLIKELIKTDRQKCILHTHTLLPDGLVGVLIKRKFGIPHICTIHGSDINITPFENKLTFILAKYALRRCDRIITVSKKLKEKVLSIENKCSNITTIYNGADPKEFRHIHKDTARRMLGITKQNKIILYIGNLIAIKGINNLIKAFAKLLKNYDKKESMTLFLVGDGDERDNLTNLAKTLHIENAVSFLGVKPHNEIPLWLNAADIFVLPSLSEGFPLVIPEAMMCGVPIVATDVGGISEAIINKNTGLLIKPNDVDAISEAISLYLKDEQFTQDIVRNAKSFSEEFTWERNAKNTFLAYKTLLDSHVR